MKRTCAAWIVMAYLLFTSLPAVAQDSIRTIEPKRLLITYSKTTNLIFPYAIKSIDRGSGDVLVQKAMGVENILQLKAAQTGFPETNLTVITADGSYYSYLLNYADSPAQLSIRELPPLSIQPVAVFTSDATTDVIGCTAKSVNNKQPTLRKVKDSRYGITVALAGLFIHDDIFYFQLMLTNNSTVSYNVGQLRLFVRDRKKARRTASQEIELAPLHIAGEARYIPGNSKQSITIAVPKFTIPDKKYFYVQVMEQYGGRHLSLKAGNRILTHATKL